MLEENTYRGYWWTDNDPEQKVPGTLEYQPDNPTKLRILSPLNRDMQTLSTNTVVEYDRIYGLTEDGDEMTLMNCVRDSVQVNMGSESLQTAEYLANSFIEGYAFTDDEDIQFSTISAEYPLLDQWADITGVSIDFGLDNEENGQPVSMDAGDTFDIEYEIQDSIEADAGGYAISLNVTSNTNLNQVGGIAIDETTQFKAEKSEGMISLDELFDLSKKLQDFITFAVRKSTFPSHLSATIHSEGLQDDSMNIFFDQTPELEAPERVHPLKTNFLLADIHETFEETLSTWFDLYSQIEPTFNVYFGTKYNNSMYANNQFLGFTQALETYHRRSDYTGKYLGESEFDDFYDHLCDIIPEEYDDSFRAHLVDGTFEYATEYSLRKRLDGLVDAHENVLSELPWDIGSEVHPITATRNYLTHYDDDSDAEMDRLYEFTLIMEALLEACLLTDLEIPEDHIKQRLGSRYNELTRGMDLSSQEE